MEVQGLKKEGGWEGKHASSWGGCPTTARVATPLIPCICTIVTVEDCLLMLYFFLIKVFASCLTYNGFLGNYIALFAHVMYMFLLLLDLWVLGNLPNYWREHQDISRLKEIYRGFLMVIL
jgi:hypothetical protein